MAENSKSGNDPSADERHKKIKHLRRRLEMIAEKRTAHVCEYSVEECENYQDDTMETEKRERFDEHLSDCPVCLKNLLTFLDA